MNNEEKAWMLMSNRISAAKSYRDRKRIKIREALDTVLKLASPEAKMLWAEDPQVTMIMKDRLTENLGRAANGMSFVVAALRGMLAGNRFGLHDLKNIEGQLKAALALVQEGKKDEDSNH